jgi:predicted dehydrogenase
VKHKYRFALLGSGSVAKLYVEAILGCARAELVKIVVTERSFARRAVLACELGVDESLITERFERVLGGTGTDVVVILTPAPTHAEQMQMCIEAGRHFIVEKPVVSNARQLRALLPVLRTCPVDSLSGQVLRYAGVFETAKALVDGGRLGDIMYLRSDYTADTVQAVRSGLKSWWESPDIVEFALVGGGVHAVDLLRWMGGEVDEVYAMGHKAVLRERPWHDTVSASLRFRGGALGHALVAYAAQGPPSAGLAVYGTGGTLVNDQLFLRDVPNLTDFFQLPLPKLDFKKRDFDALIDHMVKCLDGESEPISDAYDAALSAAVCLAAAMSIAENRPVRMAEFLEDT